MLAVSHELQIADVVVQLVPIDMVNCLKPSQGSANRLFDLMAML
jgi:hypothetical protein